MEGVGRLDELDLSLTLSRKEQDRRLDAGGRRLTQLRLACAGLTGNGELGPPLCVLFEGWDAGGKGGAIKRLLGPLDPRHARVRAYSAPTHDEKRHHFLWRFWANLPGWGGMAVYDRSWYGRVLVERVEGFATPEQWGRAYSEIRAFESTLVAEGMVLVKLFLHVSSQEQLERFERRANDPLKAWKLTDEDWRNRERRAEYEVALEEMFERTDAPLTAWHLVEGDSKRFARVKVVETVIAALEEGMARHGLEVPEPVED